MEAPLSELEMAIWSLAVMPVAHASLDRYRYKLEGPGTFVEFFESVEAKLFVSSFSSSAVLTIGDRRCLAR